MVALCGPSGSLGGPGRSKVKLNAFVGGMAAVILFRDPIEIGLRVRPLDVANCCVTICFT